MLGSGTGGTASDPTRFTKRGFLSDYARLRPTSWGNGIECWHAADLDAPKYRKLLVARMTVTLKPKQEQGIDPSDLKTLTDYFHDALVRALEPQLQVVDKPGPGVLVLRVALPNLVPTGVAESLTGTLVPYAFIAEAGSGVATGRPAGSTPYLGETGMEMQFRDGASGAVLGECHDTEIGLKYAASLDAGTVGAAQTWTSGYLNSFQRLVLREERVRQVGATHSAAHCGVAWSGGGVAPRKSSNGVAALPSHFPGYADAAHRRG